MPRPVYESIFAHVRALNCVYASQELAMSSALSLKDFESVSLYARLLECLIFRIKYLNGVGSCILNV